MDSNLIFQSNLEIDHKRNYAAWVVPDVDRHEVTSSFVCKLNCSTFVQKGISFTNG